MSVGQKLLDVPLPSMVEKLSKGIAEGQRSLDKESVKTAKELANTEIEVIPQITREIKENGEIEYKQADKVKMNMLEVGLNPTFYEFTESTIEVNMNIQNKISDQSSSDVSASASVSYDAIAGLSVTAKASAEYKSSHSETHSENGNSKLKTVMQPKSPPPRLMPSVNTVDNRSSNGGGGGGGGGGG